MSDYPIILSISESTIRFFEEKVRDINKTERTKALEEHDKQIRADAIDEYMNKLCDKCIQTPNECWNLECPFADDECQIVKIAEELKEQK